MICGLRPRPRVFLNEREKGKSICHRNKLLNVSIGKSDLLKYVCLSSTIVLRLLSTFRVS